METDHCTEDLLPVTTNHDDSSSSPRSDMPTRATSYRRPLSSYFVLVGAVVSLASLAPTYDVIHGVQPCIKLFWRLSGSALVLGALNLTQGCNKNSGATFELSLSPMEWLQFLLGIASYAIAVLLFVNSLAFASVVNTTILMNAQPLVLLVVRVLRGVPPNLAEVLGAVTAFAGVVMCIEDPRINQASIVQQNSPNTNPSSQALYGDFLALGSAAAGVSFLENTSAIRNQVSAGCFMFWNSLLSSALVLAFMAVTGVSFTLGRDSTNGLFGWMNWDMNRLPPFLVLVFACSCLGTMGYYRSLKYFNNLSIATACLAEPVLAIFLGYALGVGSLPGLLGWTGNVLVAGGTFAVISQANTPSPSRTRSEVRNYDTFTDDNKMPEA